VPSSYASSPVFSGGTLAWRWEYDANAVRKQQDIPVGSDSGGISVAILRDNKAYVFNDESYNYRNLCNPAWELKMNTTYRIEVRVKGSNVNHMQAFKLEYFSNDFAKFQLQAIDD
jgi:hypothetical protein